MPCKCSALWGEAEGIPLGLMSFFLVGIQGESLSLPKEHHLQACDLDVLSGCLVLGREPGASSSSLVACLDLPKLFVCLYLLVCEMGLILITAMEGRTHRFVWIPKFTFKKHFEDVKLSPKAWRCCCLTSLVGLWTPGYWRLQILGQNVEPQLVLRLFLIMFSFSLRKSWLVLDYTPRLLLGVLLCCSVQLMGRSVCACVHER